MRNGVSQDTVGFRISVYCVLLRVDTCAWLIFKTNWTILIYSCLLRKNLCLFLKGFFSQHILKDILNIQDIGYFKTRFALNTTLPTCRRRPQWFCRQNRNFSSSVLRRKVCLICPGWMYDYGEYTPPDSVSYEGHDGLYMHNLFPLQYQKTCHDYLVSRFGNW